MEKAPAANESLADRSDRICKAWDTYKIYVLIEPFSASAGTLFMYDVAEDSEEWPNTAVAEFFGKASVRLTSTEDGQ